MKNKPNFRDAYLYKILFSTLLFIMLAPSFASADENPPALGILASTSGQNNTVGIVYDFSSNFSIKPQITFYQVNTGWKTYGAALQFDSNIPVSDLFSVFYGIVIGYRYDYRYFNYSDGSTIKENNNFFSASVVLGGRCMLNERFGFFADTGFAYTGEYSKDENRDTSGIITRDSTWYNIFSIRSAELGAVFYLF